MKYSLVTFKTFAISLNKYIPCKMLQPVHVYFYMNFLYYRGEGPFTSIGLVCLEPQQKSSLNKNVYYKVDNHQLSDSFMFKP